MKIQNANYLPSCPLINSGFALGDEATQGASGHPVASSPRAKPELIALGTSPKRAPKRTCYARVAEGGTGASLQERRREGGTRERGTGRKRSLGLLVVRQQELG